MTIADALDRFLVQLHADGRSQHTIGQYRRHVAALTRWLAASGHPVEVGALDHETVAGFLASPAARSRPDGSGKKATSVNALRTSLRVFCAYLHRAGYLTQDPGRLVKRALCAGGPPKALSPEEQERFLATLGAATGPEAERDHAIFHLMLGSGIRLSAAIGLDVDHLDLAAGEATIRTKGDRTERVFLGKEVCEHLRRFVGDRTTGPIFTAGGGRRVSNRHIQRRFVQWLGKADIRRPLSPHSMRHRFALDLYGRTGDVLLVKEALHHRSIASTMVYAWTSAERLKAALV
jgi:site-specific recombinase XerC